MLPALQPVSADFADGQLMAKVQEHERRLDGIEEKFDSLQRRITVIGSMLTGAFLASGIIDGRAAAVLKALLMAH